jgi:hypothetical protein
VGGAEREDRDYCAEPAATGHLCQPLNGVAAIKHFLDEAAG